ncbi:hypothetical protein BJ878DRAFT_58346 [Calycina marina]|uniref:Uncharacterized protein n=1 Tax=Calycina marina TaxID=1763456 RepID=A0A9P7Z4B9_9HELO|nr:hypothetical protein BJ878DRAFT_58346 [Calycina marina]
MNSKMMRTSSAHYSRSQTVVSFHKLTWGTASFYGSSLGTLYSSYNSCTGEVSSSNSSELLKYRRVVTDLSSITATISNFSDSFFHGIAFYAPSTEETVIFYKAVYEDAEETMMAMCFVTERLANVSTTTATFRKPTVALHTFRHIESNVSFFALPITLLISLASIAASSIAIIYPTFKKMKR